MEENTPAPGNQDEAKQGSNGEVGWAKRYNLAGIPPADVRPKVKPSGIYAVGCELARRSIGDPEILPKLKASGVILRMEYYDPENWGDEEPVITVDCTSDPISVYTGSDAVGPDVTLRMHADIAHRFWMKKVNLIMAITRRQIIARGPIPMIMKLLPALRPCFSMYREILSEMGMIELLNYPDPLPPEG